MRLKAGDRAGVTGEPEFIVGLADVGADVNQEVHAQMPQQISEIEMMDDIISEFANQFSGGPNQAGVRIHVIKFW